MGTVKILIVDDERAVRESLQRALELEGYEIELAADGREALERLGADGHVDAVLLDVLMPGMDGFEVMEALKPCERDGYLPVLALTAESGHRTQALRYGAKDFVRKPFDPEELLLRVRNLVEVRLLYKERRIATVMPAAA